MIINKDCCKDCGAFFEVKISVASIAKYVDENGVDCITFYACNESSFEEDFQNKYKEIYEKFLSNDDVLVYPIRFDTLCRIPKKIFKHKIFNLSNKSKFGKEVFQEIEQVINNISDNYLDSVLESEALEA